MLATSVEKPYRTLCAHATTTNPELTQRALRLLKHEIAFIPHPEFSALAVTESAREAAERASEYLSQAARSGTATRLRTMPRGFLNIEQGDLLSPNDESRLFQEMNYLKYRANILRSAIDPDSPVESEVALSERLLEISRRARDRIIGANLRLVISIVKRFASGTDYFDEFLSEGLHTLVKAVDKFDFERGFRLSTYATHAIRRSLYKMQTQRKQQQAMFVVAEPGELPEKTDEGEPPNLVEARWERLRGDLSKLLSRLDRRERLIIRARFGLGKASEPRSLQSISEDLGVCKERVRQLEQRAIGKLRELAAELRIDDPQG